MCSLLGAVNFHVENDFPSIQFKKIAVQCLESFHVLCSEIFTHALLPMAMFWISYIIKI